MRNLGYFCVLGSMALFLVVGTAVAADSDWVHVPKPTRCDKNCNRSCIDHYKTKGIWYAEEGHDEKGRLAGYNCYCIPGIYREFRIPLNMDCNEPSRPIDVPGAYKKQVPNSESQTPPFDSGSPPQRDRFSPPVQFPKKR